jgi:hypothetical protein
MVSSEIFTEVVREIIEVKDLFLRADKNKEKR